MTDDTKTDTAAIPTLEDWQHWTWVMGRAQQMLMEAWADGLKQGATGWPRNASGMGRIPAGVRLRRSMPAADD